MKQEELGKQLKYLLEQKSDIVTISRWAYRIYLDKCKELDSSIKETLLYLFSMEDDPQFEYSQKELEMLAEKLIKNEKNPIQQINDMISKKLQ